MRLARNWAHLMSSTVTVAPRSGVDSYGRPSYGPAVSYQAHLRGERALVRDAMGQQVVSSQSVHMVCTDAIEPGSQVTLSTADTGSTESYAIHPPIIAVERRFDQRGPHHTVLRLQ